MSRTLLRVGHGAFVHDPRAERAQCIERFAFEPLAVDALELAGGHVEADRVTKNVVVGFRLRNVAAFFADDHGELDFPVEFVGNLVLDDFAELTDHGSRRLGEENRIVGIFNFQLTRACAFVDMLAVIDAEHDAIFSRRGNRRNDFRLTWVLPGRQPRLVFSVHRDFFPLRTFPLCGRPAGLCRRLRQTPACLAKNGALPPLR
jgi:hypothetical protein